MPQNMRAKQAEVFSDIMAMKEVMQMLAGSIQNDLGRMIENGYTTSAEIKDSISVVDKDFVHAIARLDYLRGEVVGILKYYGN